MLADDGSTFFQVACCGVRRALLPGRVLLCPRCDFDHAKATSVPNETQARDVEPGTWYLYPLKDKEPDE